MKRTWLNDVECRGAENAACSLLARASDTGRSHVRFPNKEISARVGAERFTTEVAKGKSLRGIID